MTPACSDASESAGQPILQGSSGSSDGRTDDDRPSATGSGSGSEWTEPDSDGGTGTAQTSTDSDSDASDTSGSTGAEARDFDPSQVTSCADLGLEGFCLDVHDEEELEATRLTCPTREVCRVVVHPGTYTMDGSVFTYHHWFRHYIGVLDAEGNRPEISSQVGSVFANKGSSDVQQNTILQNLVLVGPVMGVDFDGATGDPYFSMGGLSWLDGVKIDVDSRSVLFNTGPNPGGGSFWCTRCEIIHRVTPNNPNSMIAISGIDSAWLSQSTLASESWNDYGVTMSPRSVAIEDIVDENGAPILCGDHGIECYPGPMPELLRPPTLAWFEDLAFAQPH